jgi:hypothetical protein
MADVQLEAPHDEPVMGMPGGSPPVTEHGPLTYAQPPDPPPPPADAAAPGDDPPPEEEGTPEDDQRPKRTIVGDLVLERDRRQRAEAEAEQAQSLVRAVLEAPGGFDLLQRAATGQLAPAATPEAQTQEQALLRQELEATAIDLGLYDADGNPDLQTAHRITQREERRLTKLVEQAVAPLRQQTQAQTANQIIGHVKNVAAHYGIDPDMVERGMRTLPVEQMGNPEVQQTVLMTALGLQTFGAGGAPQPRQRGQLAQPPAPPGMRAALRPPVYSEPAGGRPRGAAPVLDQSFRDRLRGSGLKDAEIDRAVSNFVPGTPLALE